MRPRQAMLDLLDLERWGKGRRGRDGGGKSTGDGAVSWIAFDQEHRDVVIPRDRTGESQQTADHALDDPCG